MLKFATKFAPEPSMFQQAIISGFRNAEIWLSDELLDDPDGLIETANKFQMSYVTHFPNKGKITEQRLQNAVKIHHGLDCEAMVIHPPMLDLYGDRILEIDPDFVFAVENIRMSLDDFWKWAETSPGLNLDVEHLWLFCMPDASFDQWLDTLEQFMNRFHYKLRHVHMPGYQPGSPEHQPAYMHPRLACEVWHLLAQYQFHGLAVSELAPEWQEAKHLRQDIAMFEQWCYDPMGTLQILRHAASSTAREVIAA